MPPTLKQYTEWGINLKINNLRQKLWFNIFIRVAVIFISFVLILCISNVSFLVNFFVLKEKSALKSALGEISKTDLSNTTDIISTLSAINENHKFDAEIYNEQGSILFTTHGGQMMDFFRENDNRFHMSHEEMRPLRSEDLGDGVTFFYARRKFDNNEMLVCKKEIADGIFAEVRIGKRILTDSAAVANEFILIIASVCFVISIVWVFIFARKFSRTITEMNEITKDMASLNFERKLKVAGRDEIGQLSVSINELSDSLSFALEDLKLKNQKLQEDIEAERRLDSMRREFVANVSHELKTPIAIINGYAEGLKMDINPDSRQEYCDTIIEEGERMNRLVLSILELSKYESGQIPINLQAVCLKQLCDGLLKKIFHGKNIELKCNIPNDFIIFADSIQIEQVLGALLENAAVYTPEGGNVIINADENNPARISVFNSGSHIDNESMSRIWQSFYRGDTSHRRDSSHFGLGLSIVAAIMKMHNTNCGVYNTENGVCFWFEVKKYTSSSETDGI